MKAEEIHRRKGLFSVPASRHVQSKISQRTIKTNEGEYVFHILPASADQRLRGNEGDPTLKLVQAATFHAGN